MTTLVIDELKSSLEQEFRLDRQERYSIGAFIPYLYMHNSPLGTFKITLSKNGNAINFLETFTSADIKLALNTSDNYAHVFYPIIPSKPIQLEKGLYKITLSSVSGYTFKNNSYLGWIRQHENVQPDRSYYLNDESELAYSMRIKVFTEGIL